MTKTMTMKCHNGHDYHSMELLTQRSRLLFCRNGLYLALLHNWDVDDIVNVLDQWDLSLQESVKDYLCRLHDTWKAVGLYLLLEMVRCVLLATDSNVGALFAPGM